MAKYRIRPYPVEAIHYKNMYTQEIKEFLSGIAHRFSNVDGIYVATLDQGIILVKSYSWMVKCPALWEHVRFYNNSEFEKMFEQIFDDERSHV